MVSPDYSDWGASAKAHPIRRAPSRGHFLTGDCVLELAAETGRFLPLRRGDFGAEGGT